MKNALAIIIIAALMLAPALATQTVKTITYPIGFKATAQADTTYNKTIQLDPPDGLEQIFYAKAQITADVPTQGTRIYAGIDGEFCTPNYYTVPQANRYTATFDCTDNFNGKGQYKLQMRTNQDINNVYAEWEITYYNQPGDTLQLMATEYWHTENGTVFLQLLDENMLPVNNATCELDIYYPDKSQWVDDYTMTYQNGSDGLYYFDFMAPDNHGVYMVSASCVKPNIYLSFPPTNMTYGGELKDSENDLENILDVDCVMVETSNDDWHQANFTTSGVNFSEIENIKVTWVGMSSKNYALEIYNYTASAWLTLSNRLKTQSDTCDERVYISDEVDETITDFVNNDNITARVIQDSGSFWSDYWMLELKTNTTIVSNVKGGGEINVHDPDVTTATTEINETELAGAVWDYPNRTVNCSNAITAQEVWAYPYRNLTYIDWATGANFTWNFTDRQANTTIPKLELFGTEYWIGENATLYLQLVDKDGDPVNDAGCNMTVWYPNKTVWLQDQALAYLATSEGLYYYDTTLPATKGVYMISGVCNSTKTLVQRGGGEVHVHDPDDTTYNYSIPVDVNAISEDVWTHPDRNLTYYPAFSTLTANQVWTHPTRTVNCSNVTTNITVNATSNCTLTVEGKCPVILKRTTCQG